MTFQVDSTGEVTQNFKIRKIENGKIGQRPRVKSALLYVF